MYNYNLLKHLYEVHSPSNREKKMRRVVRRYCEQLGASVTQDSGGNLLVTKGEALVYPCIVAHLDQVQDRHAKDFRVVKIDDTIIGYSPKKHEQQGLGADDKNGIWVALEMLERFDILKAAFFVGEEIGCVGSSCTDMSFFNDCGFVIQADRRNGNDLITDISGTICSEEFLEAIDYKDFGYKPTGGMMTDVLELSERGVGVSCINFSCGYYDPHTDEESTSWSELCNARDFAEHIIAKCGGNIYPHKYESSWGKWKIGNGYYDDYYDGYGDDSGEYEFDYETMLDLLDLWPSATFDEISSCYADHFFSRGERLRSIYEDCRYDRAIRAGFIGEGDDYSDAEVVDIIDDKEQEK